LRYATPPFVSNISLREDVTLVGSKNVSILSVEFEPVKMPFGSAIIEKYEILYAKEYQNSGEVGDWVSAGFTTGNKFTIAGLDVGFKYYVVVKPYTNYGITNYPELNGGLNRSFYITLDGIQDTDLIVTHLTYEIVENKIILKWDENVKAGFYDIYLGTNYIGRATVNTFTYDKLLTEGIYYFHVYVIDKVGNKSNLFESIAVTVNRPNIVSSLNYRIDNYDICLYWDDSVVKTTYDIEYFVLNGIKVRENFYKEKIDWTGIKQYNIYAVDIAGNVSDTYNIDVNIIAPNTPSQILCTSKLYGIDIHVDFIEDEYFETLEIFANNLNDRNYAQLIYSGKSHDFYLTNLDFIDSRYFWARTRNKFGFYSDWYPAGVNSGILGQTDTDPQKLLDTLNGSISEDQLIPTLNSRIDLIDTANFVVDTNIVESGVIEGGVVGAYPTFFDLTYSHKLRIESLEATTNSNLNQISALQSELSALTTSEWDSSITYTLGRLVRHNGQVYRCILGNTNKEPGVAVDWQTYWEEADALNQVVADVETRVDTLEGQIVNKVDITDFNTLSNTVSNHGTLILQNSDAIVLKADKTEVSSLSDLLAPEFNPNTLYFEGDIVRYNGVAYRALVDLFTPAPVPTNNIYWDNIGNISNQIKTNYSEIKVNADNISLLSASLISVDGRLQTAETDITTLAQTDDNLQAQIDLKASTTDFNNLSGTVTSLQGEVSINQNNISLVSSAITGTLAVEDGIVENGVLVKSAGDIKDLLGLDLRMSKAFINIDSVEGIVLQHEQALYGTDGVFNKIAQAEQTLQSAIDDVEQALSAEISQKVAIADYTADKEAVDTRITTAESNITALQTADGNLQAQINDRVTITTYNGDILAIQQTLTAQSDDIGNLQAEYFVKTDVNGYVAGFGLVNDGATSEFAILADKFKVALPDGSGTPKQVFTIGAIDGQTAVGISGDLIIDGTITARTIGTNEIITDAANIKDAVITDAKIQSISADKITAGTIDADAVNITNINGTNIKSTSLITLDNGGKIIAGNNEVIIDTTTNGSIMVAEDGGAVSGNKYMTLSSGEINFYYWDSLNSQHVLYNTLKRVESGIASNNTTVNIPGIWKSQPKIFLSPANLQSYDGNYSSQDQSFLLEVTNLIVANGRWSFTPKAQLVLSANSVTNTYNLTAGNTLDNTTFATTAIGSPGNTTGVTAYVKLRSVRGTGTSGQYYYRKVDWRINYGTGASSWKTVSIGSTLDYISDSVAISGLSANSYNISIEAKAYDAGGTFTSGTTQYTYWDGSSNYEDNINRSISIPAWKTVTDTYYITMPDPNIPSGYSVYQIDWEIRITQNGGSLYIYDGSGGDMSLSTSSTGTFTKTATSWDSSITISFSKYNNTAYSIVASYAIDYIRATIHARKAVANSTTPDNDLIFEVATYTLPGTTVIASGTINWLAIGE
jgi:hypothetical protein